MQLLKIKMSFFIILQFKVILYNQGIGIGQDLILDLDRRQ